MKKCDLEFVISDQLSRGGCVNLTFGGLDRGWGRGKVTYEKYRSLNLWSNVSLITLRSPIKFDGITLRSNCVLILFYKRTRLSPRKKISEVKEDGSKRRC